MSDTTIERQRTVSGGPGVAVLSWAQRRPLLSVFLLALIARVIVAIVATNAFSGSLVLDDSTYFQMAKQAAAGETETWDAFTRALYDRTATLVIPVTILFKIFGPIKLVGQLLVALMGAATAATTMRIGQEYLPQRWALLAGIGVALLPSQVLWSSLLMKDAFVWVILTGLALTVARANQTYGPRLATYGAVGAGLLFLLGHLREHTLVVASLAVMLAAWVGVREGRLARGLGALAIGLVIPWVIGVGPAGFDLLTDHGSLVQRRALNAEGANTNIVDPTPSIEGSETPSGRGDSGSTSQEPGGAGAPQDDGGTDAAGNGTEAGDASDEPSATPGGASLDKQDDDLIDPAIAHLPRGLMVMLFEPYPWRSGGTASYDYARYEAVIWYPLVLAAALGLWGTRRYLRTLAFPLLAGGGILIMYALAEGNVGTAFRHRGEFVWVVSLLAAGGLVRILEWRSRTGEGTQASPSSIS